MKIKIVSKTTESRRHRTTNFCFIKENDNLICSKCLNPITNETYFYLCSDLNKVWHDFDIDILHKKNILIKDVIGRNTHNDTLCLLKISPQEIYESFEFPEKELGL